jgi:hypothetical protein
MRPPRAFSMTICRTARNNYLHQDDRTKDKQAWTLASLAAAMFLRYATHSKLIVFRSLG